MLVNFYPPLVCTAANVIFYLVCRRRLPKEYERAADQTVIIRILTTVIADFIFCKTAGFIILFIMIILYYFS